MLRDQNKTGFTLIELLVVIAIIGLLASVVMFSVAKARVKGRDSKRVADIRQLATALDLYYEEIGSYPLCNISLGGGDPFCGNCNPSLGNTEFENALAPLVTSGILTKIPRDPLNKNGCYTYEYYTSNTPDVWSAQCSQNPVGNYFYIIKFSTEEDTSLSFPAWNYQRVSGKEYCVMGFK